MRSFTMTAAALVFLSAPALAQSVAPPQGAVLMSEVQGGGAQVYSCKAAGASYAWTLVGPNATLVSSDGSTFGSHSAGPKWTAADGSSIVADGTHPLARGARPDAVPELLLRVVSQSGTGILNGARYVTRTDTLGGTPPPDGCDPGHAGATIARHYSAIYRFYR